MVNQKNYSAKKPERSSASHPQQAVHASSAPYLLRHSPLSVYLRQKEASQHPGKPAQSPSGKYSPSMVSQTQKPTYQKEPAAQKQLNSSAAPVQQLKGSSADFASISKPAQEKPLLPKEITKDVLAAQPQAQPQPPPKGTQVLDSPQEPKAAGGRPDVSAVAYQPLTLPAGNASTKTYELLERYSLTVDGAKVEASVRKDMQGPYYHLSLPVIDVATATLLSEIRNELISLTTISMKELTDPALFVNIKARFMNDASQLIRAKLPRLEKTTEQYLVGMLMQEMLGLGHMEFLVNDPNLEEIVIPSAKELIRVFYKKYGWLRTNLRIEREEDIVNYANIIARRVGKQITVLNPLLDAHLVSGDRINAVLYPINTKGNTITIRKFARDPYTMVDLISNRTCDLATASLLWIAMEYEMNVLISGGTASGKTSFLNACMPFIPPNQRIISIEDTRELMLPEFLYWTPLVTRTPNPEGKGEVSMLDLLVNSLRMRPDRIILGEMRRKEEAMVLFEAMHTGHSVYATVHADAATETISRLVNPPISVPPNLLKAVHLNVVMFRDRRRGFRRVLHVAEFDAEKDQAKANILYRWSPEEDSLIQHSENSRFFEVLSRNTGMNDAEIQRNLKEKQAIITWLMRNKSRSLSDIGKVMALYYRNREALIAAFKKNDLASVIR